MCDHHPHPARPVSASAHVVALPRMGKTVFAPAVKHGNVQFGGRSRVRILTQNVNVAASFRPVAADGGPERLVQTSTQTLN